MKSFVSIPIRDLMNLNLDALPGRPKGRAVSIPIRDLMNLNLRLYSIASQASGSFQSLLGI